MTASNDEPTRPAGDPVEPSVEPAPVDDPAPVDRRVRSADDGPAIDPADDGPAIDPTDAGPVAGRSGPDADRSGSDADRSGSDVGRTEDDGDDGDAPTLSRRSQLRLVAAVAVLTVALDQLTKWWAVENLTNHAPIKVVGSLQLNLAFNEGAAFSFGDGWNLGPFIAVLALVVVAFLVRSPAAMSSRLGACTAGLIAGGAVGNLVDRAFRSSDRFFGGAVVDFIDLQWYPVFNVADSAVCVGAVLFVLVGWRQPEARS